MVIKYPKPKHKMAFLINRKKICTIIINTFTESVKLTKSGLYGNVLCYLGFFLEQKPFQK